MKIKKIFSAFLATTLMCSTLVAYAHDFETRTPVITYSVGEKITTEDALTAKSSMLTYNTDYDYYPLSINVTDLGKLYIATGTDYQVLNDITFTLKTNGFALTSADGFEMYSDGVTPTVGGTWSLANDNVNVGYFNMYWKPANSTIAALKSQNIYPGAKSTIENASLNFEVVLALPAGTSLTLNKSDLGSVINYYDKATGSTVGVDKATITNDSLVFGKTVDPDPEPTVNEWGVTITAESKYDNGYIWKAETTKGDGKLTKFDVTFTDADSNTLTRSVIASEGSAAFDWNVSTTFYVGLRTARTVTAAWDIAAKDGATDVPVNKTIN